jgi:hypothetical protein
MGPSSTGLINLACANVAAEREEAPADLLSCRVKDLHANRDPPRYARIARTALSHDSASGLDPGR